MVFTIHSVVFIHLLGNELNGIKMSYIFYQVTFCYASLCLTVK